MRKTRKFLGIIAFWAIIGVIFIGCNETEAEVPATEEKLPALTGTVSITGTAQVGQTLTANTSALGGSGTISYLWMRGGTIVGTDSSTYTVMAADAGSVITVTVTRAGNLGSVTSEPTTVVTNANLPALTGSVTISGTAQEGQTLTANTSALGGSGTISYQWRRGSTAIGNSNTYLLYAADVGSTITVTVTRSGNSGSVTSNPTAVVIGSGLSALTGTVTITGTAQVGQTLTANTASLGGSGTISYHWMRGGTSIGSDSSTYVVQTADVGNTITVTVNRSGNSGSVTSNPTSTVTVQTTEGLAFTLISDNSEYSVSRGRALAVGEIVIPAVHNGLPVTAIARNAFSSAVNMTSIILPNSIRYIEDSAFSGCTGLTSITIPSSVTYIDRDAFSGCTSLTSITLPAVSQTFTSMFGGVSNVPSSLKTVEINGGTSIGDGAFSGYTSLTSITIPDSVTSIGFSAFSGCTGLISITIPDSVTIINSTAFSGCTGLTSITIPNSVTSIGWGAFRGCTGLTSITIPNSVTIIGVEAFENCTSLTSVTIGNSVTSIGQYVFRNCTSLTSVTIPNSVTSIGWGAFENCTSLTSVTISNSVTSIGGAAFRNCTSLTSITIPNSVTSIGGSAFQNCTSLTSITIPNNVTSIYSGTFSGCTGLTSITLPAVSQTFTSMFGGVSNVPSSLKTVEINGGTSIPTSSFSGCSGLTTITIPESVTVISQNAFFGCTGLISVNFMGTLTSSGFSSTSPFPGDLRTKYFASDGGIGTYTRPSGTTTAWTGAPTVTTTTATSTSITIGWNLISEATGYTLYRSSSADGIFTETGTSVTNSFTDTGLTEDTAYFYRVTASYVNGTSPRSNVYTATLLSVEYVTSLMGIKMVWVPGGSFELGREIGTNSIWGDVAPVSTVTLTGFHIGKYPVTQEQYQAVMGTNPSSFTTAKGIPPATGETDAKRPVENVSWYDAIVFCNRLSMMEGLTPAYSIFGSTNPNDWGSVHATWNAVTVVSGSTGYRLPTEAQWEYAAKGGNNPPVGFTFAGSNNVNDVAWHFGNSGHITREVGLLQPNRLGIYDMSGNVWEWCWDWFGSYTSVVKNDPMGPTTSDSRIIRGGNYFSSTNNITGQNNDVRLAVRSSNSPNRGNGFRLVRP